MKISGRGEKTYLYLNGIGVNHKIHLRENIDLLPATCSPEPITIMEKFHSEIDIGIAAIFLRRISSQLCITAGDSKTLAITAWNSLWDAVLLSALFDCEAVCNFQCDKPAEEFENECEIEVTNYHLQGLTSSIKTLNDDDENWLTQYYGTARELLKNPAFNNAIYSLATYRWHIHPRAMLALLWSGIEGLFNVDYEITFRLSLYIARFLYSGNEAAMTKTFSDVKRLYKKRSKAVHGSELRGEPNKDINDSVELLSKLVKQCIITGNLPNTDNLAP